MVIVKTFLLICVILAYPLAPGVLLLGGMKKKKEEYRLAIVYLGGVLLCGLLFGTAAFFGVRFGKDFDFFFKAMRILALLFFVLCLTVVLSRKKLREGITGMLRGLFQKPGKAEVVIAAAFLLVAGVYLLHPFLLEPGHDTAEKVITILDTGALAGWDALTGEAAPVQGNWKQQLENLPLFYACLCRFFALTPAQVLFGAVPYAVLFAVFCVISLFAELLFEQEKRSRAGALLLFALITVCGNSAYMNTSFGLLHYPYEAMTLFSCILLPLAFCFAMKKENPLWVPMIFAGALFAVGVEKAFVIFAVQAFCYAVAWGCSRLFERREN